MHVDFVRVRLDRPVQATAVIELQGVEDAPGVREGGVLEQITREITVEALPRELPETIPFDASGLSINDTVTLAQLPLPSGVTLIDDPETTLATLTPPRLEV